MMQAYGDIDIALDPTPYNGGTTTLQALWMGVPVVVLEGTNFASRMGASFMAATGQPSWVAQDAQGYVAVAVALAGQRAASRSQRGALRERMAASPLCDIAGYVAHFEMLLQSMWARYANTHHAPTTPTRTGRALDRGPALGPVHAAERARSRRNSAWCRWRFSSTSPCMSVESRTQGVEFA